MKFVRCLFIANCLWVLILSVASFADGPTECPGDVSPKGDIDIFVGFDLVINCTRHPSCKFLTEDIFWVLIQKTPNGKDIDRKYIKNNSQLHIPSVNVTNSGKYTCMVKTDNSPVTIGNNVVTIIHSLLTNASLQCTSYNLENMTCYWTDANVPLPYYYVNWTMSYIIDEKYHSCTRPSRIGIYSCTISGEDYPKNFTYLNFTLSVFTNRGDSSTWFYISHYENVTLRPPILREITNLTARSVTINWDVNTTTQPYLDFDYNIEYESQWGSRNYSTNTSTITLEDLVPNSLYKVKLYVRLVYDNHYNKWSEPDTMEFTTNSTIPDIWNATVPGCFWQQFLSQNQRVIMYWKPLPKENQNGEDFYYQISVEGENITKTTTTNSIILEELTSGRNYTITLKGVNNVGESQIISRLFLNQQNISNSAMPISPIIKDVVKFNDSTYYVEWENTDNSSIVVFWCEDADKADIQKYPTNCIDWLYIDNGKSNVTLKLDTTKSYIFAISSFADDVSRGMVWRSCEIPQSKSPIPYVRDRDIKFSSSTDYINITWSLPCKDRFQDITGFNISYNNETQFVPQLDACNNKTNVDTCSYALMNLLPGIEYSIGVALVTTKADGDKTRRYFSTKSDTQNIAIADKSNDDIAVIIIIVAVVTIIVTVLALIYTYKKFFRDRLKVLKNVQLPSGILESNNNVEKDIKETDSSSVCTVHDEFNKLQSTSSSLSIYNSSGFVSQCTSFDSGLNCNNQLPIVSGDHKSEDNVQEEVLVRKDYMRSFSQSLEDIGIQKDELHSRGYIKISNILSEDHTTQHNEEKPQLEVQLSPELSDSDVQDKKPSSSGYVRISYEDLIKKKVLTDITTTTDKPEDLVTGTHQELDSRGYVKLSNALAKDIVKQNNTEELIPSDAQGENRNLDIQNGQLQSHGYVRMSYAFNDNRKEKNSENYPSEDYVTTTQSPSIEQDQEELVHQSNKNINNQRINSPSAPSGVTMGYTKTFLVTPEKHDSIDTTRNKLSSNAISPYVKPTLFSNY